MDALAKTSKIQYEVKRSCEEMREGIQSIYDWTKEIKEKEKKLKESEEDYGTLTAVRSQVDTTNPNVPTKPKSPKASASNMSSVNLESEKSKEELSEDNASAENNIRYKSNSFKEKGNQMFKLEKFNEAIEYYSNAINYFNGDPNFYTNRAICYLRQERYDQCIEDCNKAILLDKKNVKAYYRRMQAFEGLGKNDKALIDCKTTIKMDPKNFEARRSLERLNQKFRKLSKNITTDKPTFTNLTKNMDIISAVNKPAYLRSNKPLKRIEVLETIGSKDDKNYENSNISNETVSDEVLDKLFNNNNISYTEIKKPQNKIQDKTAIQDMNADSNASLNEIKIDKENLDNEKQHIQIKKINKEVHLVNMIETNSVKIDESKIGNLQKLINNKIENIKKASSSDFPNPTSPAQFHAAWRKLDLDEKFNYFKNIPVENLNHALGSGLEPDLLTDIFIILNNYYIKNKLSVHEILTKISQHDEFSILALFLSKDDRDVLHGLLDFMRNEEVNADIIEKIKFAYYLDKVED